MAATRYPGLKRLTLDAVMAESIKAAVKHPGQTLDVHGVSGIAKLAALGEEFGEVMQMLTYDKMPAGLDPNGIGAGIPDLDPSDDPELAEQLDAWRDKFVKELIQVANLAAAWAQSVDEGGN